MFTESVLRVHQKMSEWNENVSTSHYFTGEIVRNPSMDFTSLIWGRSGVQAIPLG